MRKGKVSSMQRGAQYRDREPDDGSYPGLKIKMTRAEVYHFAFGNRTQEQTIARLTPIVREYARAGFRKPKDVARLLNHANIRTADDAAWTPRSAALLLSLIFTGKAERDIPQRPLPTPVNDSPRLRRPSARVVPKEASPSQRNVLLDPTKRVSPPKRRVQKVT